jgi:chemotaxis methyl-accepting protein methylase
VHCVPINQSFEHFYYFAQGYVSISICTKIKRKIIQSKSPTYIVGIGASAGGLEALFDLLPHLKPNGRMAYVIAQHMAHDGHSDLMQKLLSRYAHMDVILAEGEQAIAPDSIYLIPAGKDGVVRDGVLYLQAPVEGHLSTPSVNVLFKSLAQSHLAYAMGVVLSGTGSDGVLGCRAIKKGQGMTYAQDPNNSAFNGMPTSAIEAGVVDQILSPRSIAESIIQQAPTSPNVTQPSFPHDDPAVDDETLLLPILELVLKHTGINFLGYRTETLRRRLDTRMAAIQMTGLLAYYDYLQTHPDEILHIQQLFLVSFSSFFRDAASFETLSQHLLEMIQKKSEGSPVNIWVAGCASGEEVYTLAIALYEIQLSIGRYFPIRVTGTDLNPIALAQARSGDYSGKDLKEMLPALIQKYLVQVGDRFVVNEAIQALCQFEQANVLESNQIGTVDVVSCRNLLIYLKTPLQEQLIALFHQVLLPGSFLFLGQSESLSPTSLGKFKQVDMTHRLYARR